MGDIQLITTERENIFWAGEGHYGITYEDGIAVYHKICDIGKEEEYLQKAIYPKHFKFEVKGFCDYVTKILGFDTVITLTNENLH